MPVDEKWNTEPPPIAAASSELTPPAPPLWPRCPLKSGGPSRKAPAVPPPADDDAGGVAEVDPEEQNRINETVWVRRADMIHHHHQQQQHHRHHHHHHQQQQQQVSPSSSAVMVVPEDAERPLVPERTRRSSSLNGRRHSNRVQLVPPVSVQLQTAALPVDLSQDSRIARQFGGSSGGSRVCCEHHRKQNQLKQSVQRGHDRPSTSSSSSSSSNHRSCTPANLSAVFTPPQRRDASLPTTATTVPLPMNSSVSSSTSTSLAANLSSNHSRLSDMPVAMMQWPISSTPVPSSQASAESLAGEGRVARLDNEYVADPSRTTHRNSSTDDVKPALDNDVVGGGGVQPADGNSLNTSFRLPPGVLNTDDQMLLAYMKMSETLGSKRSPTNARPIHSPASDGPIVCQQCGGCRCKSCADAARRVNDVIDTISCVRPVRRLCCTDLVESGPDFDYSEDDRPSSVCCGGSRGHRRRRGPGHVALGVLVAALCLPCLCCYWPMKAGHAAVSACRRRYTGQVGVCQCRGVDGNSNLTV